MALVALEPCAICKTLINIQVHHVRVGLRTMGVRVSDFQTIALCRAHHDMLHKGNEDEFWRREGVDPIKWIADFSG